MKQDVTYRVIAERHKDLSQDPFPELEYLTEDPLPVDAIIVTARCCRDWPVLAFTRIGRCGYCGQVPLVIEDVS